MRIKIVIILLHFTLLLSSYNISGVVINSKNVPLEDVIVSTEEIVNITNKQGQYEITDIKKSSIIVFHKIGYTDVSYLAEKVPSLIKLPRNSIKIPGIKVSEKSKQKSILSTSNTIIIKNEDKNKYRNAADLLRLSSNLNINGTSLIGEKQTVSFPGYDARHTMILLDGVPLNKSGEAFDISSIPGEIIKKVEIIKGASTAQTGYGTMGGAINIITGNSSDDISGSISHNFGAFGLEKSGLSLNFVKRRYHVFASATRTYVRNNFKYVPRDYWENPDSLRIREHNEKSIYDIYLKCNGYFPALQIKYKLLYQDFFKKLPGPINNPELFYKARLIGHSMKNFLKFSKGINDFLTEFNVSYFLVRSQWDNTRLEEPYSNNLFYYKLGDNKQDILNSKFNIHYQERGFTINFGVDHHYEIYEYIEQTNESNSIPKKAFSNFGGYTNTRLKKDYFPWGLSLSFSGRIDHSTKFGNFNSWKIEPEVYYNTLIKIFLGGSSGNGFTIPSFYSLFWRGDSQVSGNPDLIPEESYSRQLYTKLEFGKSYLKLSYRYDKLKNKIIWFQDFNNSWKPKNIGAAEITNMELEAKIDVNEYITINGNYLKTKAIERSRDENGLETSFYGNDLIYTPKYSYDLGMDAKYKDFNLGINLLGEGDQFSTRDQLMDEHTIAAYNIFNADLFYHLRLYKFTFITGYAAKNIFNNLYEVYEYMPEPGFNWEVSLQLKYHP